MQAGVLEKGPRLYCSSNARAVRKSAGGDGWVREPTRPAGLLFLPLSAQAYTRDTPARTALPSLLL
jgi:hypothetical protein